MKTKRINTGNWDTAFWESDGPEKTIIFVHGNSGSKKIFSKQFDSDLANRYRLIAPDLPGHGETTPVLNGGEKYSVRLYSEFLVEFAVSLNCEEIIFVGYSFGGHLILEGLPDLEKIASGIIIFGASPFSHPDQAGEAWLPNHIVPLLFQETLTVQEAKTWQDCLFSSSGCPPDFCQTDIMETDPKCRSSISTSFMTLDFNNEIDAVSQMSKPLAIFHGEDEQLINLDYLNKLDIPTLWRGKIEIIPNAGHTPQWEQPEQFNSLLEQFIGDLENN